MLRIIMFYLLYNIGLVSSVNILFLSPIGSHSHHLWNRAIVLELVNKGYNVTFMSPDKDNVGVRLKNYTFIQFENLFESLDENFDMNKMSQNTQLGMIKDFLNWERFTCKHILGTQGLKTILNYPKNFKFDLILYDITIGYCLYPLIVKFNYPPTIAVTSYLLETYVSYSFGNSLYSSYIPHHCGPYSNEMTFYQRLSNYIFTRYNLYVRITQLNNADETRKVFGGDIPRLYEVERHISLVLANTDPIMDYPQPLPPNIIPVAGLHIKTPKRIPQDFQQILDNATNGVIVFSLGTLIRSDKLSNSQKKIFVEAFRRMNETIIWKYESQLENLPENVIIRKWIPQSDLLTHRNVKLFIGHGGASSTQEALYHGVPTIIVPFIVDQYHNAHRIVQKQVGLTINIDQITPDYVYNTIREVLDNPIYRRNMKKISERIHDQPQKPMERAIFWIEYILRHGSEDFLSPKARDMPYYQSEEVDIIAFLAILLILILFICLKIIRTFLKLFKPIRKIKMN